MCGKRGSTICPSSSVSGTLEMLARGRSIQEGSDGLLKACPRYSIAASEKHYVARKARHSNVKP
jgi:hypothetical protein